MISIHWLRLFSWGDHGLYDSWFKLMKPLEKPPRGRTATHPYLHKVVILICTPTTTYHFIPSNLQRHNRQLGYWWRAWSRWMIWTSYSDRGELGPMPTSPQRIGPGWRTRTHIGKPEEWSTEDRELRAKWRLVLLTLREKKCLNISRTMMIVFRRRVFSCWND